MTNTNTRVFFKVGDRVRCVEAGYIWTDFTVGKIYEVTRYGGSNCYHKPVVADDLGKPWLINNNSKLNQMFELAERTDTSPNEEAELEALVRKANEGAEAIQEIQKRYHARVEWKWDDEEYYWRELSERASRLHFRVKPPTVPKFEPFTTSNGWRVELKGDTLHIGCRSYEAGSLKHVLKCLLDGEYRCYVAQIESPFYATRYGIEHSEEVLPWEDAQAILNELERAGV